MSPSEQQLSAVLREFARTMVTEFPIQAILDRLVERIVDVLPVSAAGVTLISAGVDPRLVAASDEAAFRFEDLQSELGEGPCVLTYQTGEAVTVADLRNEDRFPKFTSRALKAGLAAVFTFPLRHGEHQLGALDLYRDTPGPLSHEAMTAAQTLADVAAAYLFNAQIRADLQDFSDRSRQACLHDDLTGLPNRILMLERLQDAFLRGRRSGKRSAVLLVGLDRFKAVNDTYGHGVGDELLVATAKRLTEQLRPGDALGRLSGDEFAVLCEDLDLPTQATAIGSRLNAALSRPFILSRGQVETTASIGIAFGGSDERVPEQLLHDADAAMYQAKSKGGARLQVLDSRLQQLADRRAGLARDLHGALGRGELHTEYQPIVTSVDGRITGVEALLRWTHPTRGMVPPETVVPLAERSGLITEIGRWVLEQAWADRRRWQSQGRADDFAMSVNVSTHQLMSAGFVATVAAVLKNADTDPRLLTLEVTESVFVRDGHRALLVLNDLKEIGVLLALDDFGTGYSSLSYLKRFPVDIVKIDQSFVADLGRDSASHIIVGAVVHLAHDLGMTVVAEGVETAQQLFEVNALGCDTCQGYYFARPMPAAELDAVIHPRSEGRDSHLPLLARAVGA